MRHFYYDRSEIKRSDLTSTRQKQIPATLPKKFSSNRSQFQNSASQCLTFHQWWRMLDFFGSHVTTRYASRTGGATWRYNYSNTRVTTTTHCTTPRIHQKGYQEAVLTISNTILIRTIL